MSGGRRSRMTSHTGNDDVQADRRVALASASACLRPRPRWRTRSPISTAASRSASSCAPLPATDYDSYSRLIARFMGKHIPGNPSMIVVNMTGRRRHHRRQLHGAGRAARRHRDRHRQPGARGRSGARHVAAAQGQPARVRLDRQRDLLEPAAGHLAHLADQDAGGRQEARHHHRHHRRGLGLGAVSVVLQQRARHQIQDHLRLSAAAREIDLAMERGEVEGRGTNPYSSYMGTHPTWIPQKQAHPAGAGRHREGAGAAGRAADHRACRSGRRTSRCWNSWRAARPSDGRSRPRRACRPSASRRCARPSRRWSRTRNFIAAAAKEKLDIRPQSGDTIAEIVFGLLDTPQDVRERMKAALQPKCRACAGTSGRAQK